MKVTAILFALCATSLALRVRSPDGTIEFVEDGLLGRDLLPPCCAAGFDGHCTCPNCDSCDVS